MLGMFVLLSNFFEQLSGKPLALGDFWKFVAKITHFRHISAKIQPKNLKLVLFVLSSATQPSNGGGFVYTFNQDLTRFYVQEKNRIERCTSLLFTFKSLITIDFHIIVSLFRVMMS